MALSSLSSIEGGDSLGARSAAQAGDYWLWVSLDWATFAVELGSDWTATATAPIAWKYCMKPQPKRVEVIRAYYEARGAAVLLMRGSRIVKTNERGKVYQK